MGRSLELPALEGLKREAESLKPDFMLLAKRDLDKVANASWVASLPPSIGKLLALKQVYRERSRGLVGDAAELNLLIQTTLLNLAKIELEYMLGRYPNREQLRVTPTGRVVRLGPSSVACASALHAAAG